MPAQPHTRPKIFLGLALAIILCSSVVSWVLVSVALGQTNQDVAGARETVIGCLSAVEVTAIVAIVTCSVLMIMGRREFQYNPFGGRRLGQKRK
jgi:hypothetical protein